ncbi:methyl-accepting chemotaxis protein [Natranaerovirga pectinivora]|uniref:Methyl-accepting chemotaxis protein n=1 Tax=Natranaerovirga pectinivora TaxID=682400 RepID=A0A4V2V0K6_9FIRM|nr:methyl-accepting chemotaxis protein [Natranaerovirga pectinivora]TCT16337.1 methyl-accepting chemotaxis protein [Natranaerovirga pectinivora]
MINFKRKSNKQLRNQVIRQDNNNDIDTIIEVLKDINENFKSNKSFYVDDDKFENKELTKRFNELLDLFNGNEVIDTLNKSINNVTQVDFVSSMLNSVRNQNNSLDSMVSSSEELKASVEEVSNNTQQIVEFTNETYKNSKESVENIKESIAFVKKSFEDIQEISERVDNFNDKMQSITKIIDVVKSIAEQTNLLSLNASIEAARAGEHGLGFAVVADEVRKLSESTKNSAIDIEEIIKELQGDINVLVENMNSTSNQLENGNNLVSTSVDSVIKINDYMGQINETISRIARTIIEQDTVMDTITKDMNGLSEESKYLDEYCNETGKLIFEMARLNDRVRGRLSRYSPYISFKEWIEIYKTDHVMFVYRIQNMLLGFEKLELEKMNNPKACKLGTWYFNIDDTALINKAEFQAIGKNHNELHRLADLIIKDYYSGNIDSAKLNYGKMKAPLEELIKNMDIIKNIL